MAEAALKPQRGVFALRKGLALALAVLVGACVAGPRVPPPVERPRPEAPRPVAPVQPGLPEDVERHRVALLVPMSGTNAGVGRSLANATQLALLDAKAENLRITTYDTALGAAAAARKAIAEGNKLILGPLLAEDAKAVAPIAKGAGVPVLSFSNDVSVAGNGVYTMGYSPAQSIERVVDYAKTTGITEFAGLMPRGVYGERASTALLRAVERAGGRVISMQVYDRSPASLNGAIAKLNANPFQAVLIADSGSAAASAVTVLRRGSKAQVLGTELWNSDTSLAGHAVLSGAWFASVPDAYYRQYAAKYRARFGAGPYRLSTLGYDAVLLTIRIARDWRVGQPFPESRLTDRDGFAGLDGAFRFGRDGVAERALEVQEVRAGTIATVSPAPTGFTGR